MGSTISNSSEPDSSADFTSRPPIFSIIPEPVSLLKTNGYFTLPEKVVVLATPEMKLVVDYLKEKLSVPTGKFVAEFTHTQAAGTIRLVLNPKPDVTLGNEGYQLSVTPALIVIKANQTGTFLWCSKSIATFPKGNRIERIG
ncbi:glycoside hydrolase family 20 zincin-like fold domain-containing protein [Pedobacter sp. NJ-S-72]